MSESLLPDEGSFYPEGMSVEERQRFWERAPADQRPPLSPTWMLPGRAPPSPSAEIPEPEIEKCPMGHAKPQMVTAGGFAVQCSAFQCWCGPMEASQEAAIRAWNSVAALRRRAEEAEREAASWKQAKESADSICLSLSKALGPDGALRALGFDPERVKAAEQEVREGKYISLEELTAEIVARAAKGEARDG